MTEGDDAAMDELIKAQSTIQQQMQTFVTNYNRHENKSIGYIEARLQGLEKYWETFFSSHETILSRAEEADKKRKYFAEDTFSKVENSYFNTKGSLMETKNKLVLAAKAKSPSRTRRTTECKLPMLEVPTFSGNLLDWPSFSDLFKATIHYNVELTNSQRLQYLKASLKGDAASILRTTKITDANFAPAWKSLEERYNVASALVHAQIHTLFSQPKASNVNGIKSLFDVTIDCLNSLANMNIETTNWDPILIYIIQDKLPASSLALWNQLRFGKKEVPTWDEMKTFLQSYCMSAEIETPEPSIASPQTPHKSNHGNCEMRECNEEHSIRICPLFLQLDEKDRIEMARQVNLCLNCLRQGHKMAQCSSEHRCLMCNKKHHTLLHLPIQPNTFTFDQTNL